MRFRRFRLKPKRTTQEAKAAAEAAGILGIAVPRRAVLAAVAAGLGLAPAMGYAMSRRVEWWWGDSNPSLSPAFGVWQRAWSDSGGLGKEQESYHWVDPVTADRRCHLRFKLETRLTDGTYYVFNAVKSIREGGKVLCYVNHLPGGTRDYTYYYGAIPTQQGDCWISGPGVHHITSWQDGYTAGVLTGSTGESVWELKVPIPYWIDASAGTGGSITSAGRSNISPGGSKSYTIAPSTGYKISQVTVDGSSKGAIGSYSFTNVWSDHTIKATFSRIAFTVRFFPGYGANKVLKTQTVYYGDSATAPSVSREGYDFQGWNKGFTNVKSNIDVTALWKIKTFTVRFHSNYAPDKVIKSQSVNWGSNATAPASPTRAGWKFAGWDRGFTNVKSNIDVYAKWEPDSRVRYHADGELMYTQSKLTPGTDVQVPKAALDACRRAGCTPGWTGWFTDSACTKRWNGGKVPAGTLNLYSYNTLTVSFAATADSATTTGDFRTSPDESASPATLVPAARQVRYKTALTLSLPGICYRNDGDGRWRTYRASGYFGAAAGTGSPQSKVTPTGDLTLYLRWAQAVEDGVETMRR